MAQGVHIGQAAKQAGISVDTIRFYQKLGLIKCPSRSVGGYRLFDGDQIRDLKFVRRAQEFVDRSEGTAGVAAKASRMF
jgi:DNA-binding transcriptional MerR regulator